MDAKKKSWLYAERLAPKHALTREVFLQKVALVPRQDRVSIDECGVDDTLDYAWGWSLRGTRCQGERLGHKTRRISILAALCQGQLLAPLTFEGTCHAALFEMWFERHLLPELQTGQVVILDNASFHRHARLRELLATRGCTLLPLPPYSPDLNDIEHQWNTLKTRIALDTNLYTSFHLKVDAAFV